jgi:hypothetical protein
MPFPTVLAGVAKFSDTLYCPPLTTFFLPLLFFFEAPQTTIEMHSSNLSIPNLSKHFP